METTDPRVPGYSGRAAATTGTAPHEKKRKTLKTHRKRLAPKQWMATLLASGVPRDDIIKAFAGKSESRCNRTFAIWRQDADLTGIARLGGNINRAAYEKMKTALEEALAEEAASAPAAVSAAPAAAVVVPIEPEHTRPPDGKKQQNQKRDRQMFNLASRSRDGRAESKPKTQYVDSSRSSSVSDFDSSDFESVSDFDSSDFDSSD